MFIFWLLLLHSMKRKLIQLNESTTAITLPSKWVKEQNLKKGDELTLTPKSNMLMVSPEQEKTYAELKAEDYGPLTRKRIYALYKKGIDEIKITYSSAQEINELYKVLDYTSGFEIVNQGKNFITIRNIATQLEGFDPLFKRTLRALNVMLDEGITAMKKKDWQELNAIALMEKMNNRHTNVCRRMLNKNFEGDLSTLGAFYNVITDLERTADNLKELYVLISLQKKYLPNTPALLECCLQMIENASKLMQKADRQAIEKFLEAKNKSKILIEEKTGPETINLSCIRECATNFIGPVLLIQQDLQDREFPAQNQHHKTDS